MTSVVKNIKSILPGFIVALIVALSSMFLAKFVPALGAAPIAIFLGMFVGNIFLNQKVFQRGYKFSESDLLSYSIVLLGATLSISTISEIGLNGVMFIVLQMTATIIGALYIDQGIDIAKKFIYGTVIKSINSNENLFNDYKSQLQELVQTDRKSLEYVVTREDGPAHDKEFEVNVVVGNLVYGTGIGKTKKEAEQNAAKDALRKKANV